MFKWLWTIFSLGAPELLVTMADASFRIRAEMLSRPLALLLGIFWIKMKTPWHDTSPNLKICFAGVIYSVKELDVSLISEAKEGPILEKCVEYITDFNGVSNYSIPVSSWVILLNLDSFPISLLIPFQVFFVSAIIFEESIVIVHFSILNFIINLIFHVL